MRALRCRGWPASRSPSPRTMPECRTTSHTAAQLRVSHEWPLISLRVRRAGPSSATAAEQHPVAVLFAEVAYIRASGPEDSQAQEREHGHEGEVVRGSRTRRGLVAGGCATAGRTCASSSVSAGPPEPRGVEVGATCLSECWYDLRDRYLSRRCSSRSFGSDARTRSTR